MTRSATGTRARSAVRAACAADKTLPLLLLGMPAEHRDCCTALLVTTGRKKDQLRALWAEGMDWHPGRLNEFNQVRHKFNRARVTTWPP